MPKNVEEILERSLVCAFTVISERGWPITHPMLPLYDSRSQRIYLTSSVLFSKKLERIRKNPNVSLYFYRKEWMKHEAYHSLLIQGEASIIDRDIHKEWERLLPLWRIKEPYIDLYLAQRIALPLFWERAIIEIIPKKIFLWEDKKKNSKPLVYEVS
ncbi:MAG: pyridoxamine 5'-phosphate oxidase family protein [Nitrososphaerales archaeon]